MGDWENWAGSWTDLAVVAQAGAAVITVIAAIVAAFYAAAQVRQSRELREEQARPFVTVSFRPSHGVVCNIVIKNEGATLARNVRFTFSPEWESSDAERNKIKESKLWREGLATLVPGQEIAILADMFPDRYKRTDLPTAYDVEVRYEGAATRRSGSRSKAGPIFVLNYALDFEIFYGYNQAQLYGLHELADAVRKIRARLDSWCENPSGRLSVVARDGDQADREELREFEARRQRLADERRARPTPTPQDVVPVEDASSAFVAEEPVDRGAGT